MKRFLIIQTAFIGDVILALPVAQRLREKFPDAEIHFLVRKGNESLLAEHPDVTRVWVRDKNQGKLRSLRTLIRDLRKYEFDAVYNLHRFASSGWLTARMRASEKVCFDKNPLRFFCTRTAKHEIPFLHEGKPLHEVQRNLFLLENKIEPPVRPRLHIRRPDEEAVAALAAKKPYVVISPASVWFTKQLHEDKWKELLQRIPLHYTVYFTGAPGDAALANKLMPFHLASENLCGKLSLVQSAALMRHAEHVFVNDSAPLHLASAVNAKVTAFFCSTIPAFGFGPLSEVSFVREVHVDCRPCGLHGHKTCPKGHFHCAMKMDMETAAMVLHPQEQM